MTREGVQESVRERRNSEIQKDQRGRDGDSNTECLKKIKEDYESGCV